MWTVQGGKTLPLERDSLIAAVSAYSACLVDVGTGDGRFVYRYARENPDTYAIGLDPVREALRETSARAAKKPARGGLPNVLLVMGAAEELPGPLAGLADVLTVNYPWGSLLKAVVEPVPEVLAGLSAVARPGARVSILLNYSVFEDADYSLRLGLPPLSPERAREELSPTYRACGIEIEEVQLFDSGDTVPHRTSWGQHLLLGSKRKTLLLAGRNSSAGPGQSSRAEGGSMTVK
jgi:16S rRNA (adenine(1408)-N(1))-methyltransferase